MIRACIPDSDYDRVAELLNLVETNPVTADTIRRWDSRAGFILRRSVSVDDQNRVTGGGGAFLRVGDRRFASFRRRTRAVRWRCGVSCGTSIIKHTWTTRLPPARSRPLTR
ncbi:MAG: hypothetical protein DWB42_09600 [Chloroflexi bacterium]|nr:hypothetical protein [Chloroflexota bacterium]MDL1883927.1 hypothetical protein [Anaerolineae bacterium CFX8]